MKIQDTHPHTQFVFDKNGNLTSIEPKNFPGTGNNCQGLKETAGYERALSEQGFIEEINQSDRTFKQPEGHRSQEQTQAQNLKQKL